MTMYIKEWFYEKEEEKAMWYNTFIDTPERNEDGTVKVVDGYVLTVVEEILQESEKAIKVRFSTGSVVGSYKGWTTWIPKSVVRA